jgi:hypothetical protein
MHICEPASALSFKQSQAMNLSMNSEMPSPVAFFIQRYLLLALAFVELLLALPFFSDTNININFNERIKYYPLIVKEWFVYSILLRQANDVVKTTSAICLEICFSMFIYTIPYPELFIF